jgi:hypothetical protein
LLNLLWCNMVVKKREEYYCKIIEKSLIKQSPIEKRLRDG